MSEASSKVVRYEVVYEVGASTVGTVSFDPAGMSDGEVILKAIYDAETSVSLCSQCGSDLSLGDVGDAGQVTADGEVIWDASQPIPGEPAPVRDLGELWDSGDIGKLFDPPVLATTVKEWRRRWAGTDHPCPKPNGHLGTAKPVPFWLPERAEEWREWERTRPTIADRQYNGVARRDGSPRKPRSRSAVDQPKPAGT